MHLIRIADFTEDATVLAGARSGARLFAALAAALPPPARTAQPLYLDFSEVVVATASFLRESVLPLKALARTVRSSWYPVVANASPEILEELEVVCSARSDAILACRVTDQGNVHSLTLVGSLDAKQRDAYEFVISSGGTTAKMLMEATATAERAALSPTAWNNRLSALVEKGIVSEVSEGRQKVYTPVVRCS